MITKTGGDLKVGDVIEVWWAPRRDTIIALHPYVGKLADQYPDTQIAEFAQLKTGMTIFLDDDFNVLN